MLELPFRAKVLVAGSVGRTSSYGRRRTILASHAGIAAEELTAAELRTHQADHPVVTCLVARR